MNYAATRLALIKTAASVAVSQRARELKAQGRDIIDLGLGEPDFDTPTHIVEAAHTAALRGETRYTPMSGTQALRQSICNKLLRDNRLEYGLDEIIVSNGAKQSLFNAMLATLEEGDEVLLIAPFFGSYEDIVTVLGGKPVTVTCRADDGFRLQPEDLAAAITDKTRWIIFNTPSNPCGVMYSSDELHALGKVLEAHPRVLVLSDEIYEHIRFEDRAYTSFAAACPRIRDRVLTVNGVSKAYAMTGWRIGYAAGPRDLIKAMTVVQSQVSSAPCSIAQAAASVALDGPQGSVHEFCAAFEERRDLVVQGIAAIEGLGLVPPEGAFYAYVDCSACIGLSTPDGETLIDDVAVVDYLLSSAGVAAVPGSAYGLSPFFRLSTATSSEVLANAIARIAVAIDALRADRSR